MHTPTPMHPILRLHHIMMHGRAPGTTPTTAQAPKARASEPKQARPASSYPPAPARRPISEQLSAAAHTLHPHTA